MIVSPSDVAGFLGEAGNAQVEALAAQHIPYVTAAVKAYTRGKGFDTQFGHNDPEPDLALVITAATARMVKNPEQDKNVSRTSGPFTETRAPFLGWTLPELAILHRYRRRAR